MGQIAEKERAIADLMLLDRAARDPGLAPEAISKVRTNLAREVGPTVTRAMAARLLGVTQPGLDRWIDRGDIPLVKSPTGKSEVPLDVVLTLTTEVADRRAQGDKHPLATTLRAQATAAEELDRSVIGQIGRGVTDHTRAQRIALVYHRAVAKRLNDDMLQLARDRLRIWEAEEKIDERYAHAWNEILDSPKAKIAKAISRDDQRMADLRQNSPLAGSLSEAERKRVLEIVTS